MRYSLITSRELTIDGKKIQKGQTVGTIESELPLERILNGIAGQQLTPRPPQASPQAAQSDEPAPEPPAKKGK